jgi:hypothetical protein
MVRRLMHLYSQPSADGCFVAGRRVADQLSCVCMLQITSHAGAAPCTLLQCRTAFQQGSTLCSASCRQEGEQWTGGTFLPLQVCEIVCIMPCGHHIHSTCLLLPHTYVASCDAMECTGDAWAGVASEVPYGAMLFSVAEMVQMWRWGMLGCGPPICRAEGPLADVRC